MELVEFSVEVDAESTEPVCEAFRRYGCGRIVVEQHGPSSEQSRLIVRAYAPNDDSQDKLRADMEVVVRLLGLVRPVGPLQYRLLQEEDWARAWRKHFTIQHVGKRVVVCPTWLAYQPQDSEIVISLDPGMAFGTGVHPTTRMCLEALDGLVEKGMRVMDVGTGSGILAIGAAKLGAVKVTALDVDPVAVEVARENVAANSVGEIVEVAEGTLWHDSANPDPRWDVVVANITVNPIVGLAPHIVNSLSKNGVAVLSGLLEDQGTAVEEAFEAKGASIKSRAIRDDWLALVFSRT